MYREQICNLVILPMSKDLDLQKPGGQAAVGIKTLAFDTYQGIVGCTPTNVPLWEIPI